MIEATVQQVAWFLVATALIGILARRLQVPYVIALVGLGLMVAAPHLTAGTVAVVGTLLLGFRSWRASSWAAWSPRPIRCQLSRSFGNCTFPSEPR